MKESKVAKNTAMLYIMSIAKLILPLLTLPYLTRVLSEETYGMVAYVKNCMVYMQLIIDFGFILSSVKDIVNADGDQKKIGVIVGNTFLAKTLLSLCAGVVLIVMCACIQILQINPLYVALSFLGVVTTSYLADFLFRGIEKMHYITLIYVVAKLISTAFTFLLVKGDSSFWWIPALEIVSNLVAVGISFYIIHRLRIPVRISRFKDCFLMIKDSFFYFLSSVATTAFSALNTVLIGIYITDLVQVAHWSLCLNIVSSIQGLYAPISNSVYPHMIKEKSLKFIHKVLMIFMPLVLAGCVFCFFAAKYVMLIIGGEKYVEAYALFRWMIPILFFSFPAQMYGWPTLGAIGKVKETTASTIFAAVVQVCGLGILILCNRFDLISLAILRFCTEALMLLVRMIITYKNRRCFIATPQKTD